MKRLSHRGKDKSKPFDGTINPKAVEIVNHLLELLNKQTALEGIYRIPGDMGEVRRTKEAMNQGKKVSLENMNPHTQASLLKAFYKELEDPLFSAKLYPGWIAAAQHKERKMLFARILNMLPQQNFQLISNLMIHLQLIAKHSEKNLMTAENLAIVFGPILLRPLSVSAQTLLADVPWVNKCIGLLITECSFFFKNKLLLLHRQTEKTALFEEMRKAGAAIMVEERKKREKEEKRLKEEQRKSERKKKYNTYSSKRNTVKALLDSDPDASTYADPKHPPVSVNSSHTSDQHTPTSPAPDPSSPSGQRTGSPERTRGAMPEDGRPPREAPPPLPPLPNNLPPPPLVNSTLRRSVSAYIPAPNPSTTIIRSSVAARIAPVISPRRDFPSQPFNGFHSSSSKFETIPTPPPPPPPLVLTEEEKQRQEEDERLLHNMRRRYVDRRKQTLDRWFKKQHTLTEEEFNKAMQERAERIERGEYSPEDLQKWFAEMGEAGEPPEDEDPLHSSHTHAAIDPTSSSSTSSTAVEKNGSSSSDDSQPETVLVS